MEGRLDVLPSRVDMLDLALMTTREHLTKHDREIAAIRKLILQGMRMLVDYKREHDREMRELRASQAETDRELKALIRSLRGGTNGHSKRRVD